MAIKIARVFDVPVDYLLGEGKHASYDKDTVKRLEDIETLDGSTKSVLFNIIDTYLRDANLRPLKPLKPSSFTEPGFDLLFLLKFKSSHFFSQTAKT